MALYLLLKKQDKYMDQIYSLGLLLNRASVALSTSLNAAFDRQNIDLPHSQFIVLRCLYYKNDLSQLEIAKLLSKDAAAIKRSIDNLEKKQLVARKQTRVNKNCISITKQGKELLPSALKIADSVIADSLQDISPSEADMLKRLLTTIYSNLEDKK